MEGNGLRMLLTFHPIFRLELQREHITVVATGPS